MPQEQLRLSDLKGGFVSHGIRLGNSIQMSASSNGAENLSLVDRLRLFFAFSQTPSGGISTSFNHYGDAPNTSFYQTPFGAVFSDGIVAGLSASSDIGTRRYEDGTIKHDSIDITRLDNGIVVNNAEIAVSQYHIKGFYWKPGEHNIFGTSNVYSLANFTRMLVVFKSIMDSSEIDFPKLPIQLFRQTPPNETMLEQWVESSKHIMPVEHIQGTNHAPTLILDVEKLNAFFKQNNLLNPDNTVDDSKLSSLLKSVNSRGSDHSKIIESINGICEITDCPKKIKQSEVDFTLSSEKRLDLLTKTSDFRYKTSYVSNFEDHLLSENAKPTKREYSQPAVPIQPLELFEVKQLTSKQIKEQIYHTLVKYSPKDASLQEGSLRDATSILTVGIKGVITIEGMMEKEKARLRALLAASPNNIPQDVFGIGPGVFAISDNKIDRCYRFIATEMAEINKRIQKYGTSNVVEVNYNDSLEMEKDSFADYDYKSIKIRVPHVVVSFEPVFGDLQEQLKKTPTAIHILEKNAQGEHYINNIMNNEWASLRAVLALAPNTIPASIKGVGHFQYSSAVAADYFEHIKDEIKEVETRVRKYGSNAVVSISNEEAQSLAQAGIGNLCRVAPHEIPNKIPSTIINMNFDNNLAHTIEITTNTIIGVGSIKQMQATEIERVRSVLALAPNSIPSSIKGASHYPYSEVVSNDFFKYIEAELNEIKDRQKKYGLNGVSIISHDNLKTTAQANIGVGNQTPGKKIFVMPSMGALKDKIGGIRDSVGLTLENNRKKLGL